MPKHFKIKVLFLIVIILLLASPLIAYTQRVNMTYLYAGNTSLYGNYMDRSKESVNIVCPDYLEIFDTGDLKLLTKIDTVFVDAMHERGVKVIPFLSNHWNRELGRKALQNKVSLVAQIVSAVSQYGFDGINIDIEDLRR